jgi:hypothetical protein
MDSGQAFGKEGKGRFLAETVAYFWVTIPGFYQNKPAALRRYFS